MRSHAHGAPYPVAACVHCVARAVSHKLESFRRAWKLQLDATKRGTQIYFKRSPSLPAHDNHLNTLTHHANTLAFFSGSQEK